MVKSVDTKDLIFQKTEDALGSQNLLQQKGVNCEPIVESIISYNKAGCETVYSKGDSYIVLGRDRPSHKTTGYGGRGHTKAASIDLIVGRLGYDGEAMDLKREQLYAEPDFLKDSARIYISQKSDVDSNFSLMAGKVGMSTGQSAIGIKADAVRIISRDGGIKLVTNTDVKNSSGEEVLAIKGIDLVAGNDDSQLQPMALGTNLLTALEGIMEQIDNLTSIVDSLHDIQMKYNGELAKHTHISNFPGNATTPSEGAMLGGATAVSDMLLKVKKSIITQKTNLAKIKNNNLSGFGKGYILSRYNNNN
jgi:hypothetical protein